MMQKEITAIQTQWEEIAAAVRAQLAKQVELMPAMKTEEVGTLISAIDAALWIEVQAMTWDERIEERRRTLEREAAFGG